MFVIAREYKFSENFNDMKVVVMCVHYFNYNSMGDQQQKLRGRCALRKNSYAEKTL